MATEPLVPRITKSTAVSAILARFPRTRELLERFELAKNQANLWDGERDGIREAVKTIADGNYDGAVLSRTSTAAVCYPNAEGKVQLENTLQTTIQAPLPEGLPVIALQCGWTPEELVDKILSLVQHGKDQAVNHIAEIYIGSGVTVANSTLYKKEAGEKTSVVILPEV